MEDPQLEGKNVPPVEVKQQHPSEEEEDDEDGFEVLEQDVKALAEIDQEIEKLEREEKVEQLKAKDEQKQAQSQSECQSDSDAKEGGGDSGEAVCKRQIVEELFQLKSEFCHWTEIREATIRHLREIADYIDTVSRRSVTYHDYGVLLKGGPQVW